MIVSIPFLANIIGITKIYTLPHGQTYIFKNNTVNFTIITAFLPPLPIPYLVLYIKTYIITPPLLIILYYF